MVRPSKTTLEDSLIFILLMFSMIINWKFFGLGFVEFNLNHFNIFCISYFRSFKIVCRLILQLYIVLLSVKLHIFVLAIKRKRSLISKLKNNAPKIEPCGTPPTISSVRTDHTNHCKKNSFLFFVHDLLGSYL